VPGESTARAVAPGASTARADRCCDSVSAGHRRATHRACRGPSRLGYWRRRRSCRHRQGWIRANHRRRHWVASAFIGIPATMSSRSSILTFRLGCCISGRLTLTPCPPASAFPTRGSPDTWTGTDRSAHAPPVGCPAIVHRRVGGRFGCRSAATQNHQQSCELLLGRIAFDHAQGFGHRGMFPCFLGGSVCLLVRSKRNTRVISTRVSCGLITAST
jgi:hypothetical protein